jgi:O-antigen ligase
MSHRLNRIIFVGLIAAVVFTALAHGAVEPWSVAVFEILMVGLLLLWGIQVVVSKRCFIHLPAFVWPLAGLAALGVMQSVVVSNAGGQRQSLSLDVEATRQVTLLLFCLLAAAVLAASFVRGRERLNTLLDVLVAFGFALAVFALIQHFSWNGKLYWLRPITAQASAPFGPFVNHNHFAGYVAMLAPLPVALIVARAARTEARLWYGFAAALMGLSVIVSLSRGGILSLMAAMTFVLLMSFRFRPERATHRTLRNLAVPGSVAFVLIAIIAGIFWLGAEPVINRLTAGRLTGDGARTETFHTSRGWIWEDTLRMISARPLIGVGLGAYQTVHPNHSRTDGSLIVDKAHNDYLHLLAETGVIGGALALWFAIAVFGAVARGVRSRDPLMAALALGSGGGIVAMLIHSFFDFNLQLPANSLLFLLLAVTASLSATAAAPEPKLADDAIRARLAAGVSS